MVGCRDGLAWGICLPGREVMGLEEEDEVRGGVEWIGKNGIGKEEKVRIGWRKNERIGCYATVG